MCHPGRARRLIFYTLCIYHIPYFHIGSKKVFVNQLSAIAFYPLKWQFSILGFLRLSQKRPKALIFLAKDDKLYFRKNQKKLKKYIQYFWIKRKIPKRMVQCARLPPSQLKYVKKNNNMFYIKFCIQSSYLKGQLQGHTAMLTARQVNTPLECRC